MDWGSEWRYGERLIGKLGGTARTLEDIDGRCDLGNGVVSRNGYSVLDGSDSMLFDGQDFVTTRQVGNRIDGYMFCYGYDYVEAMGSRYAIPGRHPIVP